MSDIFEIWSSSEDQLDHFSASQISSDDSYISIPISTKKDQMKNSRHEMKPGTIPRRDIIKSSNKSKLIKISPDDIQNLKVQIQSTEIQNSKEYDELQRHHMQELSLRKQENLMQEQSLLKSYEVEYRNNVWTISLNNLGQGVLSEDLSRYFQKDLSDKQYNQEKTLLQLKQQYEEHLEQVQQENLMYHEQDDIVDPKAMAQMIYSQIMISSESNDTKCNKNSALVDLMINRIAKEDELLQVIPEVKMLHPKMKYPRKSLNPSHQPLQPLPNDTYSIQRKQIEKTIEKNKHSQKVFKQKLRQTDKFMMDLRKQIWFSSAYPHFG